MTDESIDHTSIDHTETPKKDNSKYIRTVYQNFMTVVEALEENMPLPMTQKQLVEKTGLSKNVVFDVCKNLIHRKWATEIGDGSVTLNHSTDEKASYIGRMAIRLVRDTLGLKIDGENGE